MGEGIKVGIIPFLPLFIVLGSWTIVTWEDWTDLLFLLLVLAGWLVGYLTVRHQLTTEKDFQEASKIKQVLSRQRHDWMNHIQVLMGYQSLKKYDRISRYLQKLVQEARHERNISEIQYPPLAVMLLTLSHRYGQWNWKVRIGDDFQLPHIEEEKHLLYILEQVISWLEKQGKDYSEWTSVDLGIAQEDGCSIVTIEVFHETGALIELSIDLEEWTWINDRVSKWRGKILPLHENQGILVQYNW